MSRKKKNQTRNNKPSVSTSENSQLNNNRNDNVDNNERSISDYHYSDSSSDSGKSEFDEEYQRNRPPLIPIDPSRIRPIVAQNPIIIDNSITNDLLKNNEDEIDVQINKLSKSKRKRLRRQRKKLGNPPQSNDIISVTPTNNTQPIIDVEVSLKQELNDENVIEHPNVINTENERTTNNKKKKRARKRGGRKRSSTSIQQQTVLKETDENVEKSTSNTKINNKNSRRSIFLNRPSHTFAEIVAQDIVKEMRKVIGAFLFPVFEMTSTVRSSYHMFRAAVEVIKASNWEIEYERIPLLVDTIDSVHYEEVKNKKKRRRKRTNKNKKVAVIQSDYKNETKQNHLSYAEILKTKVNTRTTGEQ